MKNLFRYDGYSPLERVDDILDKIFKYGIKSITELEKKFLDAYSSNKVDDIHRDIIKEESEKVFEDDDGNFKFELTDIEVFDDEIHYRGIMYVPDLIIKDKVIKGRLTGEIVYYTNGITSPDFYKIKKKECYDIFEFCEGLEYELDLFIDYIVSELK